MTDTDELPSDQLLERIKKLWAKGESAKTMGPEYEQEALTFLAAAQRLLDKYNLSMSDVEFQLSVSQDPVKMHYVDPRRFGLKGKKREVLWQIILASIIAENHHCRIVRVKKSNSFYLVGRRVNRQVAEYVYSVLAVTVDRVSEQMYVKRFYECRDQLGDVRLARGYKQNFIDAFIFRIHERFKAEATKRDLEHSVNQRAMALVRTSQETGLVQAFADKLREAGETEKKEPPKDRDADFNALGILDGRAAADKAHLGQTGLNGPTDNRAKRLGVGAK